MLPFKRILVPFDFSRLAEQGVEYAEEMAKLHGAHLDILHVVEEPAFPSFFKLGAMRIYGMVPNLEKVAWTALEKRFGSPGEQPHLDFHVVKGSADVEIIRFAGEHENDLVVMTSHGLTGLQHVLMGSVAEKVVKMAPCPVLVVKAFTKQPAPVKDAEKAEGGVSERGGAVLKERR
ncbi:MAG: universal stress protein [Rhodothermales bacterium]